jgi:hypothetical protein
MRAFMTQEAQERVSFADSMARLADLAAGV